MQQPSWHFWRPSSRMWWKWWYIGSSNTMLFGTYCFLQLSLLPLHPEKRSPLIPNIQSQPFLPYWSKGMPAALDVTVIQNSSKPNIRWSLYTWLCPDSWRAHSEHCRSVGVSFLSFVFDTWWCCSDRTVDVQWMVFMTIHFLYCFALYTCSRFHVPCILGLQSYVWLAFALYLVMYLV